MSTKRVNVLVYAGAGSTTSSVRHAVWSLRRLLGPNYAVLTVSGDQVLKEPWMASCALLVMPGGADMGYARTLNGAGNRRIKQYVQMGGKYLGLCAGGYYGSSRCEWEVGKKGMEVVGDRELAFFPGICRGLAFSGFEYQSEAGTKAAALQVVKETMASGGGAVPERLRVYYNGGGVFADADTFNDRGVEVVARYTDKLDVDGGDAALVYCKVGEGGALLSGPHPEFSGTNLNRDEPSGPANYREVVDALVEDEKQRVDFMKACLIKLGLEVSQQTEAVPSLSLLHLSAAEPGAVSELVQGWQDAGVMAKEDGREVIKGENETFILQPDSDDSWNMGAVQKALTEAAGDENQADQSEDRPVDYNSLPKRMLLHESSTPDSKQTPYFNHNAFFWNMKDYHAQHRESPHVFGKLLMYGEVVTSTNTMLDKNPSWLEHLPTGFVATATTQVAGRGRGSNVWVSPPGSMPFSFVLRHSLALSNSAPVVFVQYLAALAVVKGIQGYDTGYEAMPIKLKWPNDIYALDPTKPASEKAYVKIGGILVNSSYSGGDYTLVTGIGLNVTNAAPTTSLSQLAAKAGLSALTVEKLLASILAHFEAMYTRFCRTGFDRHFEDMYYRNWLHMDQIVTLETEGGARARIKGITTDWGLLVAEELGWQDRPTGKKWSLQSDSNSFDFFRGLLKRKV